MNAMGGGDDNNNKEVFDMDAFRYNFRKMDKIRSFMGIVAGCVAGVLGLTGLSGLGAIVLFRGAMPQLFHRRVAEDLPECDLLIIMGTSLQVAPANSLVYRIPPTALRMVMNNEKVGRMLGIMYGEDSVRDVFAHGHSDETCLDLAEQMGWLPDLAEIIDELPVSSARLLRQRLEQQQEEE